MFTLIRGRGTENIEEKIKTDRRKTLINEDKEKRRIQGKSNNNNEHLWFYFFIKNDILLKNIVVKSKKVKSSLYHHISFTVFMCCRIFETQQWYTKANISKCNSYNIIEIYINRLSLTMQLFIAMDCLILMSEKYLHFRKQQKHVLRKFFSARRGSWIHVP